MPEDICFYLQTCIVVILMLVIEYIISTKVSFTKLLPFVSYTDTCDPIRMYCLGLIVVVYSKQCCLQRNKYKLVTPYEGTTGFQ